MNPTDEPIPADAPVTRPACAHCGLPVYPSAPRLGDELFCCYGCRLVRSIVGRQDEDSVKAWALLRFGVGAFLAMNVMMISILLYTGQVEPAGVPWFRGLMLALAAPAMMILGYPFALGAAAELRAMRLGLDTLIAAGAFAAFGVSAVNALRGAGRVYFDTATMLLALVTVGKLIEASSKVRAGRLLRALEEMLPATARRVREGQVEEVPTAGLRPGDRVIVPPGSRIPVDGRIVEGSGVLDESAFTGESELRTFGPGDAVHAGVVSPDVSGLVIEATKSGGDSLLHGIIRRVDEARRRPSRSERMGDRAARLFIPFVLVLAAGAGAAWWYAEGPAKAASAALAVLVVACPCAMGIAAPLATALAVHRAARAGALVRGGDVLEELGRAEVVFFDKTGTLTTREPRVARVEPMAPQVSEEQILSAAAAVESSSEHPIGRAIVAEARRRGIPVGAATEVEIVAGRGIRGVVALVGQTFLSDTPSDRSGGRQECLPYVEKRVAVEWSGAVRGVIVIEEALRPDAASSVAALQSRGISSALLSGDRAEVAKSAAARAGISRVEAPRRPDEKSAVVAAAGPRAIMVGDGLNDAPVLASVRTGIALGAGTDLAQQSAGVVLLSDKLSLIPWLIDLSRATRRLIAWNFVWAFGYNLLALVAAAAGFLHPLLAALLMLVSSVTLLANSSRIRRISGPD